MQININEIKITHSRRKRDEKTVAELAKSMQEVGLINPVTLDYGYELIAGMHRLAAAKHLGWTTIECTLVDYGEIEAQMAELDENLIRNEGSFIERGEWLAKRKELYEILHPMTKQGMTGNKGGKIVESEENSFSKDTAEKTGLSKRTIEQSIQIGRDLSPTAKEFTQEYGITKTTALDLARLPADKQEEIISPVAAFVETLPPEERKQKAKELVEKEFNKAKREDEDIKRLDFEKQVFSLFSSAISKSCGLNTEEERLKIYYDELLLVGQLQNTLKTIEYSIDNLITVKNYLEEKSKEIAQS